MKDRLQQGFAVALYIAALYLWLLNGFWYFFALLFLLHLAELFLISWKIGRLSGKSHFVTILMTLIFGYTWWLPIQKNLLQDHSEAKG